MSAKHSGPTQRMSWNVSDRLGDFDVRTSRRRTTRLARAAAVMCVQTHSAARRFRVGGGAAMVCISVFLVACGTTSEAPITIRLIDQFDEAIVAGTLPFDVPAPATWSMACDITAGNAAPRIEDPATTAETISMRLPSVRK